MIHFRSGGLSTAATALLVIAVVSAGCGRSSPAWTESLAVLERMPTPNDQLAYPADGQAAGVNPPGFCWTPHAKAKSYRLEIRKAGQTRAVLSTEPQTSTVYPPLARLMPGEYHWQVVYLDASGAPFGVSQTRGFRLPAEAPELLMPDVTALKTRLAGLRPRLFLAGGRLKKLQQAVARGAVPAWERLKKAADAALEERSYPDPGPYAKNRNPSEEWLRTFTPGKVGSAHLIRTALAYKVTGESKYLEGARRWMMTLASWDPKGITSHHGNDEASMPMLERMAFAWDWIGDQFTAEERAKIIPVMAERGNQVLKVLQGQDFLSRPTISNHSGRVIAFLGDAGLAFLGDIPEAEKWLDYVLRCYLTSYPGWGGDEGGWSQGMSYWSFYVYGHVNFLQALREVTETDVFRRPFYRNTGRLPVYFQPPYSPRGAFGDGGYHPPSEVGGLLTDALAEVFGDPVLKWQAQQALTVGEQNKTRWREWFAEDVFATLRARSPSAVQPRPPTDLDGSRYLPDIGWVAMHSALGDARNDVWVLFKAGRFGSYSHSHADQNTFQLNAYGRALAIDSGYYPAYGTPHDNLWTRQTKAHNGVLVNGRGQPPFTWDASGQIESYERHGVVTLARGEAANAYNLRQPENLARLWQRVLKIPLPSMDPKVETFERTLAFVASRTRPVLVVHDYLKTSAPTTFEWLLHALNRMETDRRSGSIVVQDGAARLAVRLAATTPYRFAQSDAFPVTPEIATNTAYVLGEESFVNQWHLTAATERPAQEIKILAVMAPYRASEEAPKIVPLNGGQAVGFRIGAAQVAAWWGAGPRGEISANGLTGEGRFVLRVTEDGKVSTIIAQ